MSRKEELIRSSFADCVYLEDSLFDDAITGVLEGGIVAYDYNYMFDALIKSGKYTNKTAVDYLSSIIDEVSKHIYPGNTYLTIPHIMNKPKRQLPKNMNNDMQSEKLKVLDILNKFSFILGQRAGRELWFDKPKEVQDEDLSNFNEDIRRIKTYVESSNQPIWYKVKDNILPPINTPVRCVLNWCNVLYYATGWYNAKGYWDYTDNANGDAELIAWAYLPEYKK